MSLSRTAVDPDPSLPPLIGDFDTIGDALAAAATQFGDREAYVDGAQRLSYAQWFRAADGLAHRFVKAGVKPGDVVMIYIPSSIDYAICYAAAALAGAVATGLNMRLGPREIAAILAKAEPTLVVMEDGTSLPPPGENVQVLRRSELTAACTGPGLGNAHPRRRPDDPVVIIWTSGTTGMPKGAWFDHRNLHAAVQSAGVMTHAFDRKLPSTPFAHAGYMAKLWDQVAFGATVVVSTVPWSASEMLRQMREERVTLGAGVPTQWSKLLQLPELDKVPLPDLRLCVTATAPAAPELVEQITRRLKCPMISRYAMTESPSISGTSPGDDPLVLYRTVGKPQRGTELRITDDNGQPVPSGTVGRIRTRGPCVMRGYWRDPELTRATLSDDGWLLSGDLAYVDDSGNLVLVGRVNDMYIRGGYNVYPLEVENVLVEHPGVAQASVVGLKTPVIGEIGVAFIVPSDRDAPPTLEALRNWCRERLADYKAPDRVEILAQLPLTEMLKIDKNALRARLLAT